MIEIKSTQESVYLAKAFDLGCSVRNSENRYIAEELTDKAISELEQHNDDASKRKLKFYYLLKCEIKRLDEDIAEYRFKVKHFCDSIHRTEYFEKYMDMVNATLTTKRVIDHSEINSRVIKRYEWGNIKSYHWGLNLKHTHRLQDAFIKEYSLLKILKAHKISTKRH